MSLSHQYSPFAFVSPHETQSHLSLSSNIPSISFLSYNRTFCNCSEQRCRRYLHSSLRDKQRERVRRHHEQRKEPGPPVHPNRTRVRRSSRSVRTFKLLHCTPSVRRVHHVINLYCMSCQCIRSSSTDYSTISFILPLIPLTSPLPFNLLVLGA